MNRFQEDLDYKLYKIYAWGGIFLYVIYEFLSVLVFNSLDLPGPAAYLVNAGPFLLWFSGILLYWWWVFLFKNRRQDRIKLEELRQGQPGVGSLGQWTTLYREMAASGGDIDVLIRNEKKANRPMIVWWGSVNLIAIYICGFITLGSLEIIHTPSVLPLLIGVFVWVAFMLAFTPLLLVWGKNRQQAMMAPLGLAVTQDPRIKPDDLGIIEGIPKQKQKKTTVFKGERHGRKVHIETAANRSLTIVQASLPKCRIQSKEGKLTPDGSAPKAMVERLKSLRKAKRWQDMEITCGPAGIAIQRISRRANMWLYDLWLAEYLLEKTGNS